MRRELRVAGQAEPISHFTDAVEAGGFLFVSGIVPVDERRELVGGDDVVAQARCVFENMRAVLAAGGCTFADVVKVTVYLTDVDDRPLVNPVRQEVFGETRPASTLVEISALVIPGAKIEVECVALVPVNDPFNTAITWLDEPLLGAADGPLAGRTLLVKDLIDTAGIRTTYGSRDLRRPRADGRMRPSSSERSTPARSSSARPICPSSPGACSASTRGTAPCTTRSIPGRPPAARRPGTPRRSPPGSSTSGSAPTPAARSGCRRPPAGRWA